MIRITLSDAKEHLPDLIDAAVRGEDVFIAGDGADDAPMVKLVAVIPAERRARRAGSARGMVWMSDDFDDPLPDFDEYR